MCLCGGQSKRIVIIIVMLAPEASRGTIESEAGGSPRLRSQPMANKQTESPAAIMGTRTLARFRSLSQQMLLGSLA
ncbi:hypothetical protein ACHAO4_006007 [Trichoderma viride]